MGTSSARVVQRIGCLCDASYCQRGGTQALVFQALTLTLGNWQCTVCCMVHVHLLRLLRHLALQWRVMGFAFPFLACRLPSCSEDISAVRGKRIHVVFYSNIADLPACP